MEFIRTVGRPKHDKIDHIARFAFLSNRPMMDFIHGAYSQFYYYVDL